MAASKRLRCVKVCFDDQQMLDLAEIAEKEGRRVADMAYTFCLRGMYGWRESAQPKLNWEGTARDDD